MFWDKVTHSVLSKTCQHVSIKANFKPFISLTFLTCHDACHTGGVDNCPFLWILQPFVGCHYNFGHKLICCTFFILSSAISVPFITPMMLTWCANSEIYVNVRFQHFYFSPSLIQLRGEREFPSALQIRGKLPRIYKANGNSRSPLIQLCKSNLHALAPAQVGVDPRIVHKQVDTIHLQSYLDPFQLSSSGEFNHWPWNGIWMVQTLKYDSHSSKSLSTFKCGLKNWEKIEKRLNHTYFVNCSCLVTSHWTNVTLIFENVNRIFGAFVSMSSPNLLLAKLFPQLLQGGKPSLLPHVRDTHPGDEIDNTQLLYRDK